MFEEILARLSTCLKKHQIPYMVIGGQAVLLYGEPRLTRDIDITLGANLDALNTLLDVINDLSLKPLPEDINTFVAKTMVLPALDENTGIRVDFIFSFTPYESEAIARSRQVEMLGTEVFFATPEDVIIHKIFAGRPLDIEDVKSIVIKNKDLDLGYVRAWLKEFDSSAEQTKDYLKSFNALMKSLSA
jgi:predicted nucleotidyltransferase